MMRAIYNKHPWPVPIVKESENKYLTGQNLTYKQMIGEADLTAEERVKYPVVINPHNMYKGIDRKFYHLDDPNDKAMYELMILSGYIAKTEAAYKKNRDRFVGYFFDPENEAIKANEFEDKVFEAQSRVRAMSITEYDKILLALTYKISSYNVGGNLKGLSPDRKRYEILEACKTYPDEVLNCFSDYNPGIDEELFIIELINTGILFQKQDGSIMHGPAYIADSIDGVKKYLAKEENQYLRKKWQITLDERKGYVPQGSGSDFAGKHKMFDNMNLEELQRFVRNPANKIKYGEFKEIMEDREAIIEKLNVQYSGKSA